MKTVLLSIALLLVSLMAANAAMLITTPPGVAGKATSTLAVELTNTTAEVVEAIAFHWSFTPMPGQRMDGEAHTLHHWETDAPLIQPGGKLQCRPRQIKPTQVAGALNFVVDAALFTTGRAVGPDGEKLKQHIQLKKTVRKQIAQQFLNTPAGPARDNWLKGLAKPKGGTENEMFAEVEARIYQSSLLLHGEVKTRQLAAERQAKQ